MNKKIAIIGGGLFGIGAYLILKQDNYDCTLFEKNNKILNGASTNNLNRVHFGYHYPRDNETAKQSYEGYKSFKKFYNNSIIDNFDNYYFIANKSKVDLKSYIEFCKKNNLKFKKIDLNKFQLPLKNIEGGIQVNEPIYDWRLIKKNINEKLNKIKKNSISLEEKVISIKKFENIFKIFTNKNEYIFDIVIDASYHYSNTLCKSFSKIEEYRYQLVFIFEFLTNSFSKMGLAIMDGDFFSFLPNGNLNKNLFYHAKHSIIKEKTSKEFSHHWLKEKNLKKQMILLQKKMIYDSKNFFPELNIKATDNYFLSPRILMKDVKKSDRRISYIQEMDKNYFKIFSAKVDHSIDIAKKLKKIIDSK